MKSSGCTIKRIFVQQIPLVVLSRKPQLLVSYEARYSNCRGPPKALCTKVRFERVHRPRTIDSGEVIIIKMLQWAIRIQVPNVFDTKEKVQRLKGCRLEWHTHDDGLRYSLVLV